MSQVHANRVPDSVGFAFKHYACPGSRGLESLAAGSREQAVADFHREAYQSTHGQPPGSIAELVPDYLAEVAETGLWLHPRFSYSANQQSWQLAVELSMDSFFYDPGRQAEGGAVRRLGDWVYAFW